MKLKHSYLIISLILSLCPSIVLQSEEYDWLNDQPSTNMITRIQTNKFTTLTGFPRRSTGSLKQGLSAAQLACFDIVCQKPTSATVAAAQNINSNLSYLRIYSPQAWQGAADADDKEANGYPFNTTGPATANNQVFAGHWAYQPFTTLTADISTAAGGNITVADLSKTQSGSYYYVIRPSVDSWENAEHVLITKSGSTLTLTARGFKSIAKTWPAGSVIAKHTLGNGSGNKNWVYNHSTRCPLDSNGKKANQAFSEWLAEHFDKDGNGNPFSAQVDGILYDADPYAYVDGGSKTTRDADLDNDGVSDWGFDSDGTNFWGKGLELFYSGVRAGADARGKTNITILGGVAESYGVIPNNGAQMEAAWSHLFAEDGAIAGANAYNYVGFYVSGMKAQTGHGVIGPRVTDVQSKEASAIYHGTTVTTKNAPVRFSYSMTMMFDGAWFSNQNGFGDAFHYFDEDAVYTQGDNYGKSVLRTNTTDIRANNKWLGNAKGEYQRLYDESNFNITKNLFPNGDFESSLGSWTGSMTSVSKTTDKFYEGISSLHIIPTIPNNNLHLDGAVATSPPVALTLNKEYTLCFAIYSDAPERIIRVRLGSLSSKLFVTPGWSKHVLSWKESSGVSSGLKFDVGADLSEVWIDQLYLFEGNADVFRRDFDNGIILSNASNYPKTISLGKTYQRILGNLDPIVNNGESVTEVTIPAHDGLFLINQSLTGVNEVNEIQSTVYPNPFTKNFIINIPDKDVKQLEIFKINGQLIYRQSVENQSILEINVLSNQPAGIYLAKLTGIKESKNIKLIKNNQK